MVDLNKGATVELVKALSDDIRTLPDGTKASSAGAAVRGQAAEVINARVGADGTAYSTLKERCDADGEKILLSVTAQSDNVYRYFDNTTSNYLNENGVKTASSNWEITDYLPVDEISAYKGLSAVYSTYAAYYTANKEFISSFQPEVGNNLHFLSSIPTTAVYVRFSVYIADKYAFKFYNSIVKKIRNEVVELSYNVTDALNLFPTINLYHSVGVQYGKYIDSTGSEVTNEGWTISERYVVQENAQYEGFTVTSLAALSAYYDSNDNYISSFATQKNGKYTLPNIPSNAAYVRFSIPESDVNTFGYYIKSESDFVPDNSVGRDKLSFVLPDYTITSTDLTEDGDLIERCIVQSNVTDTEGKYAPEFFTIEYIPVMPNTEYTGHSNGGVGQTSTSYARFVNFYDSGKNFLSGDNKRLSTNFVTPSNCYYITVTIPYVDVATEDKGVYWLRKHTESNSAGVITLDDYVISSDSVEGGFVSESIWNNKNYISHGDSITWYDGHEYPDTTLCVGYQSVMDAQIGFHSYSNQGWSGHPMADGTTAGDGIVTRVLEINHSDYDLCTIAAGTNDFKLNVPIGTQGIIGDTSFDTTTFYGAYRKAVEKILTDKPTIRIAILTPLQRNNDGYGVNTINSAGHKLIDYVTAIRNIGEMYGIPVCDMYSCSGFTALTLSTYTIDGLHPNNTGFARMGNYLTQFVNALGV